MLIALALSGVVLTVLSREFATAARTRSEMGLIMEAQQGVQASISAISMEVRQAGACLPSTGAFIAMDGEDSGILDSLTFRAGIVDPSDMVCVRAVMSTAADEGTAVIEVDDASRFETGDRVYITRSGGAGSFFHITNVTSSTLQVSPALDADYPAGGGVFAIEERTYAIESDPEGHSQLTVSIDGEEPQPLVSGVVGLNVQYHMAPCPPCTAVNEPADEADWRTVREISIEVTARSARPVRGGSYEFTTATSTIRPRNFL